MRILITNNKDSVKHLIKDYLVELLIDSQVDLIINGDKKSGVVNDVFLFDDQDDTAFILKIDKKEKRIPIMDETKATLGKELVVFETKNHSTVIEISD